MHYWLTTDTHFGHEQIKFYEDRPDNFEELILKHHHIPKDKNLLIHLGDFAFKDIEYWCERFCEVVECRKILVRGNHDSKSDNWYMEHGWDFVCRRFDIKKFGLNIAFTHAPIVSEDCDINIHGHLHRLSRNEERNLLTNQNKLLHIEETFKPVTLKKFLKA